MKYTTDITEAGWSRVLGPDKRVVEGYRGPLISKQPGLAEACAEFLNAKQSLRRSQSMNVLADVVARKHRGVAAKQLVSLCGEI